MVEKSWSLESTSNQSSPCFTRWNPKFSSSKQTNLGDHINFVVVYEGLEPAEIGTAFLVGVSALRLGLFESGDIKAQRNIPAFRRCE